MLTRRMAPMRLIRSLTDWPSGSPCVATIGNFDGVHLGHQAMLAALCQIASERQLPSCVISFEPLPHEFFAGDRAPARLQGLRERIASLSHEAMDRLLLLRFDAELANMPAECFVNELLVGRLAIRHLLVGDDFRFGKNRSGDAALLRQLAPAGGFTLGESPTITHNEERVSSTRIRGLLCAGRLDAAAALLGRPYRISGRVVHGQKLGRQLGYPTANIALHGHRPPLRGVFAVTVRYSPHSDPEPGVANLGERPTVDGHRLVLEVHLLNGERELYGRHLTLDFHRFLRGEQRFSSLEALRQQIGEDVATARAALTGH